MLTGALAIHELAATTPMSGLAGDVPNPAPKAPPGLTGPVNTSLAWWKWGALVAGGSGLIGCGAKLAIGRRNRSNLAADGATGTPLGARRADADRPVAGHRRRLHVRP